MISLPKLLTVGLSMVTCVYSSNDTNITETQILSEDRSFSVGSALRILPLGDSITWGHGSLDGNGYRYKLLRLLAGNDITYIGSQRSGSMANSNNEGHPGALISDMSLHALKSMHLQPNVILLLAGTNDIYKDVDPATAPARLGSLIDNLITMSPNAAILVAQIPPMNDTSRNAAAQTFNAAIPGIVTSRAGSGAKVLTVEIDPRFTTIYLPDGLHPNDMGYGLFAGMFSTGIQRAAEAGWISEPVPLPTANRTVCDTFLTWDPKFGTIATGVGSADSAFVSSWQPVGRLATGNVGPPKTWWGADLPQGKWVRLADMDGDGWDDYLWVHPNTGAAILYLNGGYSADGGVNWINKGEIATGLGDAVGVMFADINGDGRDDYLWISPEGLVTAYINGGEKEGGGWLWTSLGQIAGEGTGATRETTRFADIDGDGRADYMVVGEEGSLNAWLNFGYGDKPDWYPLGIIATGIGDAAGVQLFDLNNDGRADYVWLDKDGAAKAYINNRGGSGGLAPDWINAGSIATGVGAKREELRFADLNGDGKKDYVWIDHASGALDVWFNTATGGSYVVGDGTVFADMDGDGFEDYLAISPNGAIELWLNHGYDTTLQKWNWDAQGQIATGVAARKDIRLADLDGDGLADYLVVDEKSGAVVFWRNGGRQNDGSWSWTNMGQVATGVGDGPGVQFADINGDGKADYLWVAKDGSVTAYLNGGSGSDGWLWESQGVIAKGVGAPRQDIKFADINGDGLADYLWVNRLDGSVSEWQRNGGMRDEWQWNPQGQIAAGVGANGLAVQFASLSGNGRADYLKVDPATGAVTMWANGCFGEGSDGTGWLTATCDDPGVTDASISPPLRWNGVDTSNAWLAAISYWRANQSPEDLAFPRRISNLFNGPENMDCGLTADENGCSTIVQCHDVNHPAEMFILNSFGQINRMNINFYSALHRAQTGISSLMATFSKSFAPIKEKSAIDKLVLDFVGLGFSLVAGPAWNIGLKKFAYFADNLDNAGTLKDMTNGLVMNGIAIAKDSIPGGIKLDNNENLEVAMANVVKHWAESVAAANKKMFDGSPESIQQLTQMITDGHVLGDNKGSPKIPIEDLEIQKFVQQAIFASLIPRAWGMSNEGFRPVILNSGQPCQSGNALKEYITDETAEKASVCYEEQLYYFLSATGDYRRCGATPGGTISCSYSKFKPLSGMEALDEGTFGEMTKKDLVIGALAGYKANGNRNGWPAADPGKETTISDIYDATIQGAGIYSPGVVMIPICSPELAVANWNDLDTNAPGFPCQPQTREKRRAIIKKRQL